MGKHIIVLGGGVSGLSAAWRLASKGVSVDVIEADSSVGGLSKTIRKDGYCIDVGPHSFFSNEDGILKTVFDIFDYKADSIPRTVKFFYHNKYLDYPLTAQGVILKMGFFSGLKVVLSYLKEKLLPYSSPTLGTAQETVEDWAISSFGKHLYRSFFKPYTEQFWKVPCSELSSRSIPGSTKTNFVNTLRMLLHRKVSGKGQSLVERESLPTYYYKTGFGEIPEKIAETIEKLGCNIHLNCKVTCVEEISDGKIRVWYNSNGEQKQIDGDYVISTIPLTSLVKMLKPEPPAEILTSADKLDYRSLVVLGLVTEKQKILGCAYMYMLDRPYNRISEMNEFSLLTSPPNENIVMVEIPCLHNSAAWNASKQELYDMCASSLAEDGFLAPGDVKKLLLAKAPFAYPIYKKDYAVHLDRLLSHLKKNKSLATLGRCGEFMYLDIDICMKRVFDFIDNHIDEICG